MQCISETGAMHLTNKLICYDNLEYVEVLDKMIGRNNFILSLANYAIFLISGAGGWGDIIIIASILQL